MLALGPGAVVGPCCGAVMATCVVAAVDTAMLACTVCTSMGTSVDADNMPAMLASVFACRSTVVVAPAVLAASMRTPCSSAVMAVVTGCFGSTTMDAGGMVDAVVVAWCCCDGVMGS